MSPSNSGGIQTLLEAENKAQGTVQEARAFRSQRIKASKTDAAKEIEQYKQKKEQEFSSSTSKFDADESSAESAATEAAQGEIEALKQGAEKGKEGVIKYLIEQATTV